MLLLVLADNLIVLYAGWELTTISSYLLIGNDHTDPRARAAALHALLVTSLGGLVMLAGFVLIGQAAGTYRLSTILAFPPSGTIVTVGVLLTLVGAFTKSAQYPFHAWLPGAMAAPTPVERVPALGDDGQGRRLPRRPGWPRRSPSSPGWRPIVLDRRCGDDDLRRAARPAPVRPQAARRLRHREPARLPHRPVRRRHAGGDDGRVRDAAGPRDLQGRPCSWPSARSTTTPAPATCRRIPALGPGWRPFAVLVVVCTASMAGIPLVLGFIGKEAALRRARPHRAATAAGLRARRPSSSARRSPSPTPPVSCGACSPRHAGAAHPTSPSPSRRARPGCSSARSPCWPRRRCVRRVPAPARPPRRRRRRGARPPGPRRPPRRCGTA